jgi:putative ABC transport system permease protein
VAVFINIEGFYMMDEHRKPLEDERLNSQRFASGPEDNLNEQEFQERLDQELQERLGQSSGKSADEKKESAKRPAELPADPTVVATTESPKSVYGTPLPIEQRELTAILLRSQDDVGASLFGIANAVNLGQLENEMDWTSFSPRLQQRSAQSVTPVAEVQSVFETFVTPVQWLILAMTVMICIVSGIGILVSIYNSMSERRQEIAVMRALGAGQATVFGIILAESVLLAAGGGLVGWIGAHLVNGAISPLVQQRTGVELSIWDFAPGLRFEWGWVSFYLSSELMLVPGLVALAIVVGLLPAISAYRLDVSENLS